MTPDSGNRPPAAPITIDLGLNQLIQRVDTNVTQQIIVTTADKARLCLIQALHRLERRNAWIAPAGILATLIVVFPTTTFQDFLGMSKEYWKAIFSVATVATLIWLVVCLVRIQRSLTIEEIVEHLRTDSLATPLPQPNQFRGGDLMIIEAMYGAGEHRIDVAGQLNKAISHDALHVFIGNQLAGDPCPHAQKDVVVRYRYKNQVLAKTVAEGARLDLP